MEKRLLNIQELSEYLNMKVKTIYDLVYHKKIPHIKLNRCLRFQKDIIDSWIEQKTIIPFNLKIYYNKPLVRGEGAIK